MKYFLLFLSFCVTSCASKSLDKSEPIIVKTVREEQLDSGIDNKDLVVISRELAVSSDKHFGKKTKGFCGKTSQEMQQLLRALQAMLDQQSISSAEVEKTLKENGKCGKDCIKQLCASKTFKKLDSEKSEYGTSSDGV